MMTAGVSNPTRTPRLRSSKHSQACSLLNLFDDVQSIKILTSPMLMLSSMAAPGPDTQRLLQLLVRLC